MKYYVCEFVIERFSVVLMDERDPLFGRTLQMLNYHQLIQLGLALLWTSPFFTMKSLTLLIVPAILQNRLELQRLNATTVLFSTISFNFIWIIFWIEYEVWALCGGNLLLLLSIIVSINWNNLESTSYSINVAFWILLTTHGPNFCTIISPTIPIPKMSCQ